MKYAELIQHPYFRNYQEHFDGFNMESLVRIIKEQQKVWAREQLVNEIIANISDFSAKFLKNGLDLVQLFSALLIKEGERILKSLNDADLLNPEIFNDIVKFEIQRVLTPVHSDSPLFNSDLQPHSRVNLRSQNATAATEYLQKWQTETPISTSSIGLSFCLTSRFNNSTKEAFFDNLNHYPVENYNIDEFQNNVQAYIKNWQGLADAINLLQAAETNNYKKIYQFVYYSKAHLIGIFQKFSDLKLFLEGLLAKARIVILMALGGEFIAKHVTTDKNFFAILTLLPTIDAYTFGRMLSEQKSRLFENSGNILEEIIKFEPQKLFFIPNLLLALFSESNLAPKLMNFPALCARANEYMQNIPDFSDKNFKEKIYLVLFKFTADLRVQQPQEHDLYKKLVGFAHTLTSSQGTLRECIEQLGKFQNEINNVTTSKEHGGSSELFHNLCNFNAIISILIFECAKDHYSSCFDHCAPAPSAAPSITVSRC